MLEKVSYYIIIALSSSYLRKPLILIIFKLNTGDDKIIPMTVILRNHKAHMNPCGNAFIAAQLYLDQKLAKWSSNIGETFEMQKNEQIKDVSGNDLIRITKRAMQKFENACLKGIF